MEFWRIYRILFAKRYLILATMLIAGVVIFLGTSLQAQKREYEATAILQPQENTLSQVISQSNGTTQNVSEQSVSDDNNLNIANLIVMMRSANELFLKTADLLREDASMRRVDVQHILDRNGYFATLDQRIESEVKADVDNGSLPAAKQQRTILDMEQQAQEKEVARLANGSDSSGAYAESGLKDDENTIADTIRENLTFDTVLSPLSTDATPQYADQIKVTGRFEREAQAKLYVNLLCVEFLDFYENNRESSMNAQIAELKAKRDEANNRLQRARQDEVAFQRSNKVALTAGTDNVIARQNALQTQRDQAEVDLQSAEAEIATLQAARAQLKPVRTDILPADESAEVHTLRSAVDAAQIEFDGVQASNRGTGSQLYIIAKAKLDAAKALLNQALARSNTSTRPLSAMDDLQSRLTSAEALRNETQQKLAVLNSQLAEQNAEMQTLPQAVATLADLRREIEISAANVQNLESTITRVEIDNLANNKAGTINIVSDATATPIVSGIGAQRGKLIAYGMVLAMIFGIVVVIALDALDNTVRTAEDAEKLTGLPIAGVIPEHLSDPLRSPIQSLLDPTSAAAESYRLLRTDLLFTAVDHPFQSLLIATSKPSQGATTTLCNLAIVLAMSGRRVILVDADLRHPKLHRIFECSNATGLTTVLRGNCSIDEALVPTRVENLMLLPAGSFELTPSELLGSTRMQTLHEQLKQMADFVLFDTPAAIAYSDTAILSAFVDASLMVVRANTVPRGTEDKVRAQLTKARANVIGVVLNGVQPQEVDSSYYHGGYAALPPAPNGPGGMGISASDQLLPTYSGNGNGAATVAAERERTAEDEDANAIPLPGATEPAADAATANQTVAPETAPIPALPESTDPGSFRFQPMTTAGDPSYQNSNASTTAPLPSERNRNRPRGVSLKVIGVIIVAGLVLGYLVLQLSGGTGVK